MSCVVSAFGLDHLPDSTIADYLCDFMTPSAWASLEKKKRVRVSAININLAYEFGLSQFGYTVKELLPVLNFNPAYIHELQLDFNCLSLEDAYSLLMLNRPEINSLIDISKYEFDFLKTYDILKNSSFNTDNLPGLKLDELKSYQIKDVIIHGPYGVIDRFDLSKISKLDWIEIVRNKPELLSYCDFDKFKSGDLYDLVLLVITFDDPDLTYLFDLDRIEELTPLGVEKLVVFKTDFAVEYCDLDILTTNNWNSILSQRPDLGDLRDDVCGIRVSW